MCVDVCDFNSHCSTAKSTYILLSDHQGATDTVKLQSDWRKIHILNPSVSCHKFSASAHTVNWSQGNWFTFSSAVASPSTVLLHVLFLVKCEICADSPVQLSPRWSATIAIRRSVRSQGLWGPVCGAREEEGGGAGWRGQRTVNVWHYDNDTLHFTKSGSNKVAAERNNDIK